MKIGASLLTSLPILTQGFGPVILQQKTSILNEFLECHKDSPQLKENCVDKCLTTSSLWGRRP